MNHIITPELINQFEYKVPRYTSYPTAPHFSATIGASDYTSWLSKQDPAEPISLYVHVPYCDTLCWFCACNTQITTNHRRIETYLDWLKVEAKLLHESLGFKPKVARAHFGGGSPTLLSEGDWKIMRELLDAHFDFMTDAEISVELDPRDVDETYVKVLASIGLTRASVGVQDFDPEVQNAINRLQPFSVVERLVDALHNHGVGAVNLDIMYGLPYQTMERIETMAKQCLILKPSRIALFGYAHVPWMKPHQNHIDENILPDSWERYQQFQLIEDIFADSPLKPIGLDHFAVVDDSMYIAQKEGRLKRNFQGYTDDIAPTLIGLGPSSIGSNHYGYVQNQTSISQWKKSLKDGYLPIHKGILLDDDDRMRRDVIEALMCDLSVNLDVIAQKYHHETFPFDAELEKLKDLENKKLVEVKDHTISVKMEHRLFLRAAASVFDVYLSKNKARHSRAI